jgi:hypothetical protein
MIEEHLIGKDMERSGRDQIWGTIQEFSGETEENHANLSQDSWSSDRDLNPRPPKYEALGLDIRCG